MEKAADSQIFFFECKPVKLRLDLRICYFKAALLKMWYSPGANVAE